MPLIIASKCTYADMLYTRAQKIHNIQQIFVPHLILRACIFISHFNIKQILSTFLERIVTVFKIEVTCSFTSVI